MTDKKTLRKEKLKWRGMITPEVHRKLSGEITQNLLAQPEIALADAVLCYVNYKSEADTLGFIELCLRQGKRVYCPRVLGGQYMEFYEISSLTDLKPGAYGILEPVADAQRAYRPGGQPCMILPGAVFGRDGNRIGYGKGYYDRYLAKHPEMTTIGICFSGQLTDVIPAEDTDIKVDKIITEKEVYEIV